MLVTWQTSESLLQIPLNCAAKDKILISKPKLKGFFPGLNPTAVFCRCCILHLLPSRAWCFTNWKSRTYLTSEAELSPHQEHSCVTSRTGQELGWLLISLSSWSKEELQRASSPPWCILWSWPAAGGLGEDFVPPNLPTRGERYGVWRRAEQPLVVFLEALRFLNERPWE